MRRRMVAVRGEATSLSAYWRHALSRAVVWGAASVIPEQCVELHRLLIDEVDLPAARELWTRIWAVCHVLESVSYTRHETRETHTPQN